MKGMMLVSHPTNRVLDEWPQDSVPPLEQLQAFIGGDIEAVPGFNVIQHRGLRHKCVAFCNEHGKQKGLPVNHYATVLWALQWNSARGELRDRLVGPVVIIYGDAELMAEL